MKTPLRRWLPWLLGLGLLAVVIAAATDLRALVAVVRAASWPWLAVALALQALAVLSEAEGWRVVARVAGTPIGGPLAWRLSLTKVFVDQALPSAGLSGTAAFAAGLEAEGLPRATVMAAVVVDFVAYLLAYALGLLVAVGIAALGGGGLGPVLGGLAVAFMGVALGLAAVALWFTGRRASSRVAPPSTGPQGEARRRRGPAALLRKLRGVVSEASPALVRAPRVLAGATACQLGVFALDATTLWVLIVAIGAEAPFPAVFASHMGASLVRTLGVVPGGLGVFEAASVAGLGAVGLASPQAMAVTLLFRGLSFWLPLPFGLWLSRHLGRARPRGDRARMAPGLPGPGASPDPAGPSDAGSGFASWSANEALRYAETAREGLSAQEAAARLVALEGRRKTRRRRREVSGVAALGRALGRQLASPLVLLLMGAAIVSGLTGAWFDAGLILAVVALSALLGAIREHAALRAAEKLREGLAVRATVLRDGLPVDLPRDQLVPGDVVSLVAGDLVPADGLLLAATDLHVSEARLTGESFPVEKAPAPEDAASPPSPSRTAPTAVYLGTNVQSGQGRFVVVACEASEASPAGPRTRLGAVAAALSRSRPESAFARDLRHLGAALALAMLALVLAVFGVHVLLGRPPVTTLLFAVALAVGLSPELLPAIVHLNLAHAARAMAARKVLVRRLSAIEDLGALDVLCTDKTGTLTEGLIAVDGSWRPDGTPDPRPLALASLAARLGTGRPNPLDLALAQVHLEADDSSNNLAAAAKVAELPFDALRRRASVALRGSDGVRWLVTKGALGAMLSLARPDGPGGGADAAALRDLEGRFSREGIRALAVGLRRLGPDEPVTRAAERDLELVGLVTFLDRPKADAARALAALAALGVSVKVITGDTTAVTRHVAAEVGLGAATVLSGDELDALSDEALWHRAMATDLFTGVDPNQKARILRALQHTGHVVGFLGDGVNDAPALHVADAGLSVEGAADVAREAADFVLLAPDLGAVCAGIEEGRRSFVNTRKYVLTTTSANLGNMATMALASPFLPFLPLTAGQILLNNFLSDIPAFGLATDRVDPELLARPLRWDLKALGRFMLAYGGLGTLFDLMTFALLLGPFSATPETFRTAWFVESLLTELLVALVMRTRRPLLSSHPGKFLGRATIGIALLTVALPWLPVAAPLGMGPLGLPLLAGVLSITGLYVLSAEFMKRRSRHLGL